MAESFKNVRAVGTTSYTTVYTVPANVKYAVVIGFQMTNINAGAAQPASAQWLDASASNVATRLAEGTSIPIGGAVGATAGKLVLMPGDAVQVKCANASQIEFSLSILEIS